MTLAAETYLQHLRAYVNSDYVIHDGTGGEVILKERYFRPDDVKPQLRRVKLLLPGVGMAFKLDHEQIDSSNKKSKPPLFHFLDDTAKPWSKRCDFVIFYVNKKAFCVDCIEFKSGSIAGTSIREHLRAGMCWIITMKKTIEYYTSYTRKMRVRKFIFGDNDNPDAYLDSNRQLNADPSIRYYHFDEVQGQHLAALQNTSVQEL